MRHYGGVPDRAIVFDGDDTLWDTQALYDEAKTRFFALLAERGYSAVSVQSTFEEIDVANVARFGFSRERFPQSMRETYEYLCREADRRPKEAVVRQAMALGSAVFDSRPAVRADAARTLAQLREHYRLVLFTAGDEKVQRMRVEQSQLGQHFDAVRIVAQKSSETWRELLRAEHLPAASTWSVGNSVRSDINPALELGMRCVLVAARSWAYEQAELGSTIWRAAELTEAATIVLSVDGRRTDSEMNGAHGYERLLALRRRLESVFSEDTALPGSVASTPSAGHCAAVATIIHEMLGGELLSTHVNGEPHWLNRLPTDVGAVDVDLTGDQFNRAPVQVASAGALYPHAVLRRFDELEPETLGRASLLATRAGLSGVTKSLQSRQARSRE
ncbi:HAD family hydrolase [Roseisolibacter sp. H3M3-2]|uniref:HAD family hydrolase n=1 Tax=Roseisolibacter sp. H3M3-2 TaxID=3031323 RepID=UPI0023DC1C24|nr:HAD family hydrolase [Roseisolibacter sp. H3M3-2]MDF1501322.1 HAD family hydrolase [Roseisolibacter sp. H3M3-2]